MSKALSLKLNNRKLLKNPLHKESNLVRNESMRVLHELEGLEDNLLNFNGYCFERF